MHDWESLSHNIGLHIDKTINYATVNWKLTGVSNNDQTKNSTSFKLYYQKSS